MAIPQYNSLQLIKNIKRRAMVPTSQLTYQAEDFCALATDALFDEVVPLVMSTREEFFVEYIDVPSPSDGIIEFPDDTIGVKVRSVAYVQQSYPLVLVNLPMVNLDVVAGVGFFNFNTLAGFYIQGNKLILYPNTSVPPSTTIRIYFYKRRLNIIESTLYGQVTAIDALTNTITLDRLPITWTTATTLNTVSSINPFPTTNDYLTISSISDPNIVLDDITDIAVGDYMSEEGYSAIPQVVVEAHAYLAQLTASICLNGLGAFAAAERSMVRAEKLKENLLVVISNRVDGSVKKLVNPTGGLRLSAGIGFRRNGSNGFW